MFKAKVSGQRAFDSQLNLQRLYIALYISERLHYGFVVLIIGQVLSRQNIEDVIKFAKEERLFILADEVSRVVVTAAEFQLSFFYCSVCGFDSSR
jgi:Na+/H+-dicarboxylate symporter